MFNRSKNLGSRTELSHGNHLATDHMFNRSKTRHSGFQPINEY